MLLVLLLLMIPVLTWLMHMPYLQPLKLSNCCSNYYFGRKLIKVWRNNFLHLKRQNPIISIFVYIILVCLNVNSL